MKFSTPIPNDIYVREDDASGSEHVLVESSMLVEVARYSLATHVIVDRIEHEIGATSVITSKYASESPRAGS